MTAVRIEFHIYEGSKIRERLQRKKEKLFNIVFLYPTEFIIHIIPNLLDLVIKKHILKVILGK